MRAVVIATFRAMGNPFPAVIPRPLPVGSTHADVHCLDGGSFIAHWSYLHAGVVEGTFRMYNWAFHIHDMATNRHVLWDAGMSSVSAL